MTKSLSVNETTLALKQNPSLMKPFLNEAMFVHEDDNKENK